MSRSLPIADEDLPSSPLEQRLGRWLQTTVLAAATWVIVMSLLAVVLAGVGAWLPWVVLPLALVAAVACGWWAHGIPARSLPIWTAALLVAVSVGAGIWTATTHSEQVLPRRDSASYLQTAISMAQTHRRVVPVDPASVGGPEVLALDGITLSSPAFYEVGGSEDPAVQPQFVIGPGAIWSLGVWLGGPAGAMLLPALLSALGILGLGLLTARIGAPRWSPLAAAGVALLFPVLHTARSTYSEPLAMLTLGAACSPSSSPRAKGPGARWVAQPCSRGSSSVARAFVRVDALREIVLLLPVVALAARGGRWPRLTVLGAGCRPARSRVRCGCRGSTSPTSPPASSHCSRSGVLLGGSRAVMLWWRAWRRCRRRLVPLPDGRGVVVVLVGLYLASRPLWQVVRQDPNDPGSRVVAGMQARQGLPVDGGRTYAEQTVAWLSWYVGPVAAGRGAGGARRARAPRGAVGRRAEGRRLAAGAARRRRARRC